MASRLAFALVVLTALASLMLFQTTGPVEAHSVRLPLASDWSHRHVVFSQPSSLLLAFRLSQDPRYIHQWIERVGRDELRERGRSGVPRSFAPPLKRDWSMNMGPGAMVGAGQYPAKYSLDVTTASCSNDYVAFNTGVAGSSMQASVIAYSNLYDGCGGTSVPTTLWAYQTGGTAQTSIALSLDGTQIAFVQNVSGVAQLVLLKWAASSSETASSPMDLTGPSTNVSNSSYRSCSAPCMTTISFSNGASDTYSAPFVDYGSDTLYVGDATSRVHQFTGVFNGPPAESGAPWPAHPAGSVQLSGPVFDSVTGNVFVTSLGGAGVNNGRLLAICATSTCAGKSNGSVTTAIGTVTESNQIAPLSPPGCYGTGNGTASLQLDSPIVDSAAGMLYAFTGQDGNGHAGVIQFSTTVDATHFSQNSCGNGETIVGAGTTGSVTLFSGTFDNVYMTSGSSSSPTGNFYVCGATGGDATLYQIPISSNSMSSTANAVLSVSATNTACSPVTEFYNNGVDQLFFSVESNGSPAATVNCPSGGGGCVMVVDAPTTFGGTLPSSTTAALGASGGTSGIIIDNSVVPGTLATSDVYFSTLSGGTAVQASQSNLN